MSTSVTCPAVTVMSALAPVPEPVFACRSTFSYTLFPRTGVYPLPPVILALSKLTATPLTNSVTAPCALPSALVTIVLVVPVTLALAFVGSALSAFAYVNVVLLGTLKTTVFSLKVVSSLHNTCTFTPTCKSCAVLVVAVATLLLRSIVVNVVVVNE